MHIAKPMDPTDAAASRSNAGAGTPSLRRARTTCTAFTLFEVALSLVLIAFGVITVMALIPIGIKSQQKARFELLACSQALQLLEFFSGKSNAERIADFETPEPWEARPFCYSSTRWDLETRLSRWDSGIMPVPPAIARRLDSDGDEIRTLLNQGAYLYYADARSIPCIDPQYINVSAPSEALKLVFAVSGYAQNNAVPVFSYKAWPYRAAYPSPPLYAVFNSGSQFIPQIASTASSPIGMESSLEGWSAGIASAQAPGTRDPLMDQIFQATVAYESALTDKIPPQTTRETVIKPLRRSAPERGARVLPRQVRADDQSPRRSADFRERRDAGVSGLPAGREHNRFRHLGTALRRRFLGSLPEGGTGSRRGV